MEEVRKFVDELIGDFKGNNGASEEWTNSEFDYES